MSDEIYGLRPVDPNFIDEIIAAQYPPDWPKCPGCGRPSLDGHITCGLAGCDEGGRR